MTQITPEQPHGAHLPDEAGVRRRRGAAGDDLIVLEGVNKHFGDFHALRQIDLRIPRGQVAIVLGPSGSGKSTLLRAIAGLDDGVPGSGVLEVDPRRAVVFQDSRLLPWSRVLDNVILGLGGRGLWREHIDATAGWSVQIVGADGTPTCCTDRGR